MKRSGRFGRFGIGTPQGNPTVEPEFRRLMPADVPYYVTRLTSTAVDARARLVEYLERLPEFLTAFGPLALDGFAFACTGSSYFVGATRERELVAAAKVDYPVITATAAIKSALARTRANRIALVSPYPAWLTEASVNYWTTAGYDVASVTELSSGGDDTVAIYALVEDSALRALTALDTTGIDAVLITGTGMPTLASIVSARSVCPRPVLSSNLCLAQALLEPLGREPVM